MYRELFLLQQGSISSTQLIKKEEVRCILNLALSRHKDIESSFTSSVNYVDIEDNENRYLLSGCVDGSLYIHDLHNLTSQAHFTAQCVSKSAAKSKFAHSKSVECVTWFPSDNRCFISSGGDRQLKLWDANHMKPIDTFTSKGKINHHQCFSSSRSHIAVGSGATSVELVDLRTGNRSHELRAHQGPVFAVAWSPRDGRLLATAGLDSRALLWDVRSASGPLLHLDCDGKGFAHTGLVNGLSFTPDGLHIVTLGFDQQLKLWDSFKGKEILVSYGRVKNDVMHHVELSVRSQLVLVPSKGWVRALDLWTGQSAGNLCGHFDRVNCCVFREHYNEVYSGGKDRNVLVWTADIRAPQEVEVPTSQFSDAWSSDED